MLYQGKRVGTVYVREEHEVLHIRQFFMHPDYQNRGIGSELLRRAVAQADASRLVTRVAFLEGNSV